VCGILECSSRLVALGMGTGRVAVNKDKVRRGLGHSKGETTDGYLRDDLEVNRELARRRVEKRK
jgi:hypothetical protein